MFKKAFNILYCALPDILLIVLFSLWAYEFTDFIREYGSIKEFEYGLYAMMALLFYRLYINVKKLTKSSMKWRITLAIGVALCYTVALWFLNSWWLYLETNNRLPFVLMSYKDMLWSNLTYTYSWGEFRYPLAFALMLIICFALPWVKRKLKPLGEYVLNRFLNLLSEEETTSSTIADYLYHKNALVSWCLNMSKTPEAKDELMQYVFESEDPDEYSTVIEKRDFCFNVQSLKSSEEKEVTDENL